MASQDIAIIGLSFKFAQDVEDTSSFWEVLRSGRNLKTDWPQDRVQLDAFYDDRSSQNNKVCYPIYMEEINFNIAPARFQRILLPEGEPGGI